MSILAWACKEQKRLFEKINNVSSTSPPPRKTLVTENEHGAGCHGSSAAFHGGPPSPTDDCQSSADNLQLLKVITVETASLEPPQLGNGLFSCLFFPPASQRRGHKAAGAKYQTEKSVVEVQPQRERKMREASLPSIR